MIISRVGLFNQKLALPVMRGGPGTGPGRFPTDPWAPEPSFQHYTQCYYSVTSSDLHTHTHTHTYPHSCTPLTVFPGEINSSQDDSASDICSVRCGEFTCNNFFLIRAARYYWNRALWRSGAGQNQRLPADATQTTRNPARHWLKRDVI